jgi:hypothetical protein
MHPIELILYALDSDRMFVGAHLKTINDARRQLPLVLRLSTIRFAKSVNTRRNDLKTRPCRNMSIFGKILGKWPIS